MNWKGLLVIIIIVLVMYFLLSKGYLAEGIKNIVSVFQSTRQAP